MGMGTTATVTIAKVSLQILIKVGNAKGRFTGCHNVCFYAIQVHSCSHYPVNYAS